MITSVSDILVLSGAIALFAFTIVIIFVGVHITRTLRHIARITDRVDHLTELVESYLLSPLEFLRDHIGDLSFLKGIFQKLFSKNDKS